MKSLRESTARKKGLALGVLLVAIAAGNAHAKEWQAWVGTQSRDMGSQALAFLPNEGNAPWKPRLSPPHQLDRVRVG